MTVSGGSGIRQYYGITTDVKPTCFEDSTHYLPGGSRFYEMDSRKNYVFDGVGTWYEDQLRAYYLDERVDVVITNTCSHLFAGDTLTKQGSLLRQYSFDLANSTNDVTRTLTIYDGVTTTLAIWASTAVTDNTEITRLLPTSEQVILDGTYYPVLSMSTTSQTKNITDYYILGFSRR